MNFLCVVLTMISMSIDQADLLNLKKEIEGTNKKLEKELEIAVRNTAKHAVGVMAKQVTQELNVTQKAVKQSIPKPVMRKIGGNPFSKVILRKEQRLSLKRFKAQQTRAGISYRVDKRQGLSKVAGGFMGPRPGQIATRLGGHPFKRLGKARKPIVKLHGASPWGAFKKRNLAPPTKQQVSERLRYEVNRRIRQLVRKKQGKF